MMDDRKRGRRLAAAVAVAMGTVTAVGCGDSSDKPVDRASTPAPKPAQARNTVAAEPPANASEALRAQGTVPLTATRLGAPGTLILRPHGVVGENGVRWYKRGTHVTARVASTKTARFSEWSGACTGKARVCELRLKDAATVIAGFSLDQKVAKRLPKSSPAVQQGAFGPGVGPAS